ncbi:glycine cleavage system aminomethyltransferase GcvT [Raineya orbicola]|jgi:aminomethyltransferase|uniref:Aminomethyltransferase n=1 Tax=Raineya orbicola TaxID=2016530 RepID=A0A2N3IF26_9BACT|nr:glycine cleavage system aminomethyltransferase GcvT [Raineya orbicola]PKQ68944.1 gcvT: glycine cleavage system T protein [Raineya orbicola]
MDLQKIPLNDLHESLGAKMVGFAGYAMPVRYSSDKAEHLAVRQNVGVFDVSHMGEFLLKGSKALDLIQRVCTNDASKLTDGKAQYSCMTNEKGGIVDDLLVYRLSETEYMLVVNASNIEKDWNWIQKHNTEGVEMQNISAETCLFAVQGPNATKVLQKLTTTDLSQIPYYSFVKGSIGGIEGVIISATGYTGAGGFELYVHKDFAETLWKAIFEAGKEYNIQPIGLGARDTLRLEMGYCLYGNDIDDTTSPLEAGLGWITKFTKNFTASDILQKQKQEGVQRKLVAFRMETKGIPRKDYPITNASGEVIGKVTSGTISPMLNIGIGLGYVQSPYSNLDTEIFIQIRNQVEKAKIVKLPFYEKGV